VCDLFLSGRPLTGTGCGKTSRVPQFLLEDFLQQQAAALASQPLWTSRPGATEAAAREAARGAARVVGASEAGAMAAAAAEGAARAAEAKEGAAKEGAATEGPPSDPPFYQPSPPGPGSSTTISVGSLSMTIPEGGASYTSTTIPEGGNNEARLSRLCRVVVVQPRRISAIASAHRVAAERGEMHLLNEGASSQERSEARCITNVYIKKKIY